MKLFTALLVGSLMAFSAQSYSTYAKNPTPEITLNNPDGEELKLSSLRGNVVLVDFWASWCGPCRKKHPELVGVYNQFKDRSFKNADGFEIYSVSLDNNKRSWMAAIEKDDMNWSNHVSDLQGWQSAAARAYGVRSIPSNVLLNEEGEVIGKNLFGKRLEDALSRLAE